MAPRLAPYNPIAGSGHVSKCQRRWSRESITWLAISLIVIAGTVRVLDFVGHEPILALANNFDMVRIQSCHDFWPADEQIPPGARSHTAPLHDYRYDPAISLDKCIGSTELIFTQPIEWLAASADWTTFSIRWIGAAKGIALILLATTLCALISRHSKISGIVAALSFTFVIADPVNLLYLNGFYTEFSALFSLAGCIGFGYLAVARPRGFTTLAFAGFVFALGLTKVQHAPLPALFAAWFVWAAWRRPGLSFPHVLAPIAAAVLVGAIQVVHYQTDRYNGIRTANTTNLYLGAVLGSSPAPSETAQLLGLPPSCAAAAGQTWYSPGVQAGEVCPEIRRLSRMQLAKLVIEQPSVIVAMARGALERTRPWTPGYVGQVGGEHFGDASDHAFTLEDFVVSLPASVFAFLILAPIACTIGLIGRNLVGSGPAGSGSDVFVLAALVTPAIIAIAVLGDGYAGLGKHAHLSFTTLGITWLIACTVLLRGAGRRTVARSGPTPHA
ncbi:glycan biosynthesis hexose transferase WsfD [Arhodomonas sp. AD133]|uniref:glycan biosynthesis hexose transferase WsfD n=1 Tax=Arhodomonas sp. AD133 TaxID=3415009 RepID=UPI003EBD7710